jgi:hypothetical protein
MATTRQRRTHLRSQVIVLASCLGAAAALAGCGHQGVTISGANNCGSAYTSTVNGHVLPFPCGGVMPTHPPTIKLRPGERFSLRITGNSNGTRATRAFPVPKPTEPAVVISQVKGMVVEYEAKTAGRAHLRVKSKYCPTDPKVSVCTVLTVSVS